MKEYLNNNGIKVVDCEVIQYGDKEFAVKKADAKGDIMPVLVDFAHGRSMFVIHTDHHDRQAGAEDTGSTSFRQARSNVETISQIVSPKELFTNADILLISTVDSANYAMNDISVDEVINYIFKLDKGKSIEKNKMLMGLVTNKLLLAFKNKPRFLERLVMDSTPSLLNILQNIKKIMVEKGYAKVEQLQKNKETYIKQMANSPAVKVMGNIIVQWGGGNMFSPGSYDRYTPFKNNPEADFLVIGWGDIGLVQASCNPYKKDRALKGIDLGKIKDIVLSKWESRLKLKDISLSTLKWMSENSKDFNEESIGFTFKDFVAIYGEDFKKIDNGRDLLTKIGYSMIKPYISMSEEEKQLMENINITAWDVIDKVSGGHKCITNISGLNYLGKDLQRPGDEDIMYVKDIDKQATIKFTKMIQDEFVRVLQEKIESEK
jgi:hypothetical protein